MPNGWIEQQQRRDHANQPQRRGQENHDHRRQRTHLQDNDQQREAIIIGNNGIIARVALPDSSIDPAVSMR